MRRFWEQQSLGYCVLLAILLTGVSFSPRLDEYQSDSRPASDHATEAQAAKLGHQIMVNRAIARTIEPGDIVLFGGKCWLVLNVRDELIFLRRVNDEYRIIDSYRDLDLSSSFFSGVIKKFSKAWDIAIKEWVNDGLPKKVTPPPPMNPR